MSLYFIITVIHIVSAAIGVGAAAASDSVFMASIRNRRISHDQYLLINRTSLVVLGGLTLLVITGIILVFMNADLWVMAHFQAKMTAVIILMINGLIFHAKVLPLLEQYQHTTMTEELIASRQWLLAITGAVSAVCWFSALIIAVVGDVGAGYFVYIGIMGFFIITGSVVAHYILTHIVFIKGTAEPESHKAKRESTGKKKSIIVLVGLLVVLLISLVLLVVLTG